MKPETKKRVLETNPQAAPAEIEEYEALLSQRFAVDPDLAKAPEAADLAETREARLAELHRKLFSPARRGLKITNREVGDVCVLMLDGRIVLGEESNALRELVQDLLEQKRKKILLDLAGVTLIDSAGIGALAAAYGSAKARGAELKLADPAHRLTDIIKLVKPTHLEVFETDLKALKTFGR